MVEGRIVERFVEKVARCWEAEERVGSFGGVRRSTSPPTLHHMRAGQLMLSFRLG